MSVTHWIAAVGGVVIMQSAAETNITGQAQGLQFANFTILGVGASHCGDLTANLRRNRALTKNIFVIWSQGFFTGVNFARFGIQQNSPDIGKGISPDTLLAAL